LLNYFQITPCIEEDLEKEMEKKAVVKTLLAKDKKFEQGSILC